VDKLYEQLRAGDVAALSYAISALENNTSTGRAVYDRARAEGGRVPVIGFTGPPGVGKSTLINAYIGCLRKVGKKVAVVAIDPSSPITGGAILGDRFRMSAHTQDTGVFIRSFSNRGHLGGLCLDIFGIIDLIDAAGWDVILIETVGAGQSDTDIAGIADITVVVQAPGLGDDLQMVKAGILEIADVMVVNKADMALADVAVQQLQSILALRSEATRPVAIIKTIATEGSGLEQLQQEIDSQCDHWASCDRPTRYKQRMWRFFSRGIGQRTEQAIQSIKGKDQDTIYENFIRGKLDVNRVIARIVDELKRERG
jgi:LAO/AO transport system kinase